MAFTQQTFLGASISSYSCSVGWNQQSSQLTVTVVEDPTNGDDFTPEDNDLIGTPVYFVHDDFRFGGILQKWTRKGSVSGNPVYEISVVDPREIVGNAQVIIGGYSQAVTLNNLYNAYYYWETLLGFGGAQVNEGGMPWYLIRSAVLSSINGAKPLTFRDSEYFIDLSELPVPPNYYRIGGTSVGLIDAIDDICQNGGHDYHVTLEAGNVIKFKTVSRVSQPSLNVISTYVDSVSESPGVSTKSQGRELRNEATTSFVVGGDVVDVQQVILAGTTPANATIWPFWGYDAQGNVVIGQGVGDNHTASVDSRAVNVVGVGDNYTFTVGELRAALIDQDSWETHVSILQPQKAQQIGIYGRWSADDDIFQVLSNGSGGLQPSDRVEAIKEPREVTPLDTQNAKRKATEVFGNQHNYDTFNQPHEDGLRVIYDFVRGIATEFYGRKFMVRVPMIVKKVEPETDRIVFSREPSSAGFIPEGANPLGLSTLNEDVFKESDGRLQPLVRFDAVGSGTIDVSTLNQNDYVVEGNRLFLKASVDDNLVFLNDTPRAVINLSSPVYYYGVDSMPDMIGGLKDMIRIWQDDFGITIDESLLAKVAARRFGGNLNYGKNKAAILPNMAAVPMKSNILTYGPWFVAGPAGKVEYEQDDSLVPWNYGGFTVMNLAGNAKVANTATAMQQGETGSIELPGTPTIQLGDALQAGGPNVTGISVNIGVEGVTSTMTMQTFTPSFGNFSKDNANRFRRLGLASQRQRRTVRELVRTTLSTPPSAFFAARETALLRAPVRSRGRKSRHETIGADTTISSDYARARSLCSTGSFVETQSDLQASTIGNYSNKAAVSWDGLVRPFALQRGFGPSEQSSMPTVNNDFSKEEQATLYKKHPGSGDILPELWNLNPFGSGTDIEIIVSQRDNVSANVYLDMRTRKGQFNPLNLRGMCMRGPMWVAGWGVDHIGRAYPGSGISTSQSRTFKENWQQKQGQYPVGPIDLRWDDTRNVWMGWTGRVSVMMQENLAPGQDADAHILQEGGTLASGVPRIRISGDMSFFAASGQRAIVGYDFILKQWLPIQIQGSGITIVTNVACSGTSLVVCSHEQVMIQGYIPQDNAAPSGCGENL